MDLLWPGFLALLALIPLIVAIYIWTLRRRRRYVVRFSSLALVRDAIPRQSRLRRHLPFALFLLAFASLVLALVRPVDIVEVPAGQTTIILAIDVSRSMRQTDIFPSRLSAAKDAALAYIRRQSPNTQIGIVAFSGFAELIQAPTNDQDALQAAVRSLTLGRRTAIGSGILASIDAIAEVDGSIAPVNPDPSSATIPLPATGGDGTYSPNIIVVLTDGVSTSGPLPLEAAQVAAERGIRVYTIGFGTVNGGEMFGGAPQNGGNDPYNQSDPFQGGDQFFGGFGFRRGLDEETLREVAAITGATYYSATSAGELQNVFESLPTYLITREEMMEISVLFAAIGALLAALAVGLSLAWHPLP